MQRLIERFRAANALVDGPGDAAALEALPGHGEAELDGRRALNFATGDQLGLSTDPRLKEAANAALRRYGTQGAAGQKLLAELEERLASLLGRESAVVANDAAVLLSPLAQHVDRAFSDLRRGGWPAAALPLEPQRVTDPDELELALQAEPEQSQLMLAAAVHGDDGDLSPLPRLAELCQRFGAALLIDESRSLGVLGEAGLGAAEQLLGRDVSSLIVASLDGALASRGVLLAGPAEVVAGVRRTVPEAARPSPASLAAALKACEVMQAEPNRRARLFDVTQRLMAGVRGLGLDTGPSVTPRVPVWVGDEVRCERLRLQLLDAGLWCRAALIPGRSRLVLTPQATHSDQQIDQALEVLERVGKKAQLLPEARPASVPAVTLSRPGTFGLSAACAPHWREQPQAVSAPSGTSPTELAAKVFTAVETLTWRAANLRGGDLRKWLERPRSLLKRKK